MGKGKGYGKTILFGEHFVVYGLPAIVSAIADYTLAKIEKTNSNEWELKDERDSTPGYKKEKLEHQKNSINRIIKASGLKTNTGMKIWLGGNLYCASGVGASAASCTAIARALNEEFALGFDDAKINELAFEGEKAYHGTPSGLDNTASTYGGLLWFKKNETKKNTMNKMTLKKPIEIIIANTGLVANTLKAVEGVKKRKKTSPEKYDKIFSEYNKLVKEAKNALNQMNLEKIGKLMNKNHKLLQKIGVSLKENDELVKIALDNGALGAKLTGGGLGGLVLILTPEKKLQQKIANAIEKKGFKVNKTTIG